MQQHLISSIAKNKLKIYRNYYYYDCFKWWIYLKLRLLDVFLNKIEIVQNRIVQK